MSTMIRPDILVVDDERQILAAVADMLEDNFTVHTAQSAAEGLEVVRREPSLNVIISDQRMPEMAGVEFLSRAREVSNATRVLLTGYADLEAVVRAVNEGRIFAYVSKPWDAEDFRHLMYNAAEFYRLGRMYREERALLRNLMDQAPDGLYFKDLDHRYVRLNAAHARNLGIADPEIAVGHTDEDFLPPAVASAHRALMDRTVQEGRPVIDWVERIEAPDGEPRWLSTSKAVVRDDTRRVYRVVGITRDITERLEAESQARLLTSIGRAIYLAPDFHAALGEAIRMVCNETGWVLGDGWVFDESQSRLVSAGHAYIRDERFRPFLDGTRDKSFAKGMGLPGHVWATGEPVWVGSIQDDKFLASRALAQSTGLHACLGVPIRDTVNEVIAVIVFFLEYPRERDERLMATVTAVSDQLSSAFERKRAADELARERRFLMALVDSMRDAVIACDSRGAITFVNRSATELIGRPDRNSSHWFRLARQPRNPETEQLLTADEMPLARALRGEKFSSVELLLEGAGPAQRFAASGAPIVGDGGETAGAVVVLRDVTALRETERRLRAAQRLEALGQMTSGIAHDFNNIIQVIGGSLDLMVAEGADENTVRLAATARAAVDRSAELTRKLLSFSRARELAPSRIDPCGLVAALVEVLRTALGRRIALSCDLTAEGVEIFVDAGELESAIVNLATNARDAMDESGGSLGMAVRDADDEVLRRAGLEGPGWVAISVADSGGGIPLAIRERVFEPYFTTKGEGKGTGLGLSMVYGFVTQSGGHIVLESVEGEGTTFTLLFPHAGSGESDA